MSRRWAAPVMRMMRHGQAVLNPRITWESWLTVNFVPPGWHDELSRNLDDIQQQAVHMAAQELEKAADDVAGPVLAAFAEDPENTGGDFDMFLAGWRAAGRHTDPGNE